MMITSITKLLFFLLSTSLVSAYNAHGWSPSISIASALDDPDNGYCVDISGFGNGLNCNSLQGHSCKPRPSDTQFELHEGKYLRAVNYNSDCGAASTSGNDRACVKVDSIQMDSTLSVTECNEDDELQTFTIVSVDGGHELRMGDELCLVVSGPSRQAGRYLARDLYLDACGDVESEFKTWEISPEPVIDNEGEELEDGDGGDGFVGEDDGGDSAGGDGDVVEESELAPTTTTIDWAIRTYEDRTAMVGDTIEFEWDFTHNVYIYPSGNCNNDTESVEVGVSSGASYTFADNDAGKEVTFVCTIQGHCIAGQILKVNVFPVAATEAPETDNSGGGLDFCFSGSTIVDVYDKGQLPISALQIGDKVKIGSSTNDEHIYDTVYSFGHYNPEQMGEFLQIVINTDTNERKKIELSKDHLILLHGNNNKFVPVSALKIGDQLVTTTTTNEAVVSDIKVVKRKGVYAPFTMSGTIAVSDIVASSFVTLQENKDMVTIGGASLLSAHAMAYLFESIHRMSYRLRITTEKESYSMEGISHWVEIPRELFMALLNNNNDPSFGFIQLMILLPCIVVLTTVNTVEQLLYQSNNTTMIFFFAFVAATILFRHSNKKNMAKFF